MPTTEQNRRAAKRYREKNPEKVKKILKKANDKYYAKPEVYERHKEIMRLYYYKKKEERLKKIETEK